MTRILRERDVKHLTGLSRVTRWRLERRGEFPRRVHLTQRCVGWSAAEVMEWLKARAEARDLVQIAPSGFNRKGVPA